MARKELQLGDTQVIKDLLARYANHNSRIIPLETLYAAIIARLDALEDGAVVTPPNPSLYVRAMKFNDPRNSMYLGAF